MTAGVSALRIRPAGPRAWQFCSPGPAAYGSASAATATSALMKPQPTRSLRPWHADLVSHLPEYGIEAAGLAAIVFVAALVTAVVTTRLGAIGPLHQRVLEAALIAATVLAMTYSPWGKRSGAHYNPAVTLTFLALGRMRRSDAACYIAAHAVGAVIGIAAAGPDRRRRAARPAGVSGSSLGRAPTARW